MLSEGGEVPFEARFNVLVKFSGASKVSISFDGSIANSNYINAVPVDGFRLKNQFIATQLPLPSTLQDFWTMVQEKSVNTIIILNDIPAIDEVSISIISTNVTKDFFQTCCQFYPSVGEELETTRGVTIRHRLTEMFEHYDIISFDVTFKNVSIKVNRKKHR